MAFSVYALFDPRTARPRYVGCSSDPERRLYEHLHHVQFDNNPDKSQWIAELTESGQAPTLETIAVFEDKDVALDAEAHLILRLREAGEVLVNRLDIGVTGRTPSTETKLKMSLAQQGRVFSSEHCAAISAAKTGHSTSQETRDKIGAQNSGKTRTSAQLATLSQAMQDSWRRRKQQSSKSTERG